MVNAGTVNLSEGGIGLVRSEQAAVSNGGVNILYTGSAQLQDTQTALMVARQVQGAARSTILIAGQVEGPVQTTLDTPRAILAGLTAGIAVGLVLFVGRLLTLRRR
jgi:hypothetical protein